MLLLDLIKSILFLIIILSSQAKLFALPLQGGTAKTTNSRSAITEKSGLIQIEIIKDSTWDSLDSSDERINNILTAAEAILKRDLGLSLNIKKITLAQGLSANLNIPDIYSFLLDYKRDSETDVVHLFSGNKIDSIHGAAFGVGTICQQPFRAISFSIYSNLEDDILTFLHELGHTLGAKHLISDPASIMFPGISSDIANEFDIKSINEIDSFLSSAGQCIDYKSAGEGVVTNSYTLNAFSLPLSKRKLKIKGLVKIGQNPSPGVVVQLLRKKSKKRKFKNVVKESISDSSGWVDFIVKRRGFYRLRLSEDKKQLSPVFRSLGM